MTDYEYRKIMWIILSKLFDEQDELEFMWIYSLEDHEEANQHPDGTGANTAGVVKGIT